MSQTTFNPAIDPDVRLTLDLNSETGEASLLTSDGIILATYEGDAWNPVGSDVKIGGGSEISIEEYLKTEGNNLKSLSDAQIRALSEEDQKKWETSSLLKKNQASKSLASGFKLSDLDDLKANYPTDPEAYFRGRYPINQKDSDDFDHFKITCYEHQPGAFDSGRRQFIIPDIDDRKKISRGTVTLPMQPGIQEGNTVNWGEDKINPLQIAALGVSDKLMDFDFQGAMQEVLESAKAAGGDLTPELIKSFFAGKAIGANIIGRGTGQTINNNVEVLFNGPGLRTFNYNYRFTPREPKEATEVKRIIRFFKKQMAPKRSTSRIFLKSPNVFKLKYKFKNGDHPFLNNIKMCALNGFTVDYTPDGSYSTYSDGGEGDGSMTSYNVGLSFMEMTPIYNDDFWRDSEGREGTGF